MEADNLSFLENSSDERTQAWVRKQNAHTVTVLERDPRFQTLYEKATKTEELRHMSDESGLMVEPGTTLIDHDWVYQIWSSASHPRGIWRRALLSSVLARAARWEQVLDVDALVARDRQNWSFVRGIISPSGQRCMVQLVLGGSSTYEWREFDLRRHAFVGDGFRMPLSQNSHAAWLDESTLVVSTAELSAVPGNTPRTVVRIWRRGEKLEDARQILRGEPDDIYLMVDDTNVMFGGVGGVDQRGQRVLTVSRMDRNRRGFWWQIGTDYALRSMTVPPSLRLFPMIYGNRYVMQLLDDWNIGGKVWKAESIISIALADVTSPTPDVELVMAPASDASSTFALVTHDALLVCGTSLGNPWLFRLRLVDDDWTTEPISIPQHGMILPVASDARSGTAFIRYEGVLQPPTTYSIDVARGTASVLKSAEPGFDSSKFTAEHLEAPSDDGEKVPYIVVRPKDMRLDGRAAILVQGYGASGTSMLPSYSSTVGALWLEQGGVYVIASVRGGADRGSSWWVTGTGRRHTYEDMHAILMDLIRRRISSPGLIGIEGHSNGGLLAGVILTQYPELLGAAVLEAPLLDQFRMDMAAGGPDYWAGEFGSPTEPAVREFLQHTSPFQNLKKTASFPTPFIITSTTDETVFPGQPRRFAAKMEALDMPFFFYESPEGGHGMAATVEQSARLQAMIYVYLAQRLLDRRASAH